MMAKEELITRVVALLDTIEDTPQDEFDEGEIEDLIVEEGIPITRSNGGTGSLRATYGSQR